MNGQSRVILRRFQLPIRRQTFYVFANLVRRRVRFADGGSNRWRDRGKDILNRLRDI